MVFPKYFMEESTKIIRIKTKIHRALERILKMFPEDSNIYTASQLANDIIESYIREMYTNGNDYIDRDDF